MIKEPEAIANSRSRGEIAINIVELLTCYPFFFAVALFIGSYIKSTPLIYCIMFTWMIAFYVGTLLWIILTIWLLVEKIISMKKALIYFLIAIAGIVLSFCVWIYDVFDYGFKYFD
jgi:hypothetical protein